MMIDKEELEKEFERAKEFLNQLKAEEQAIRNELENIKVRGFIAEKYVRCRNPDCKKCKEGKGHGPYYYHVYYEGGKKKWVYLRSEQEIKRIAGLIEKKKNLTKWLQELERMRRELLRVLR